MASKGAVFCCLLAHILLELDRSKCYNGGDQLNDVDGHEHASLAIWSRQMERHHNVMDIGSGIFLSILFSFFLSFFHCLSLVSSSGGEVIIGSEVASASPANYVEGTSTEAMKSKNGSKLDLSFLSLLLLPSCNQPVS